VFRPDGVTDRHEAIDGHGNEGEDAGDHAEVLDEVDQTTDGLSEWPVGGRVDDDVEGNTEDEEEEVSNGQVQHEEVRRIAELVTVLKDGDDDQGVPWTSGQDDQSVEHDDYDPL